MNERRCFESLKSGVCVVSLAALISMLLTPNVYGDPLDPTIPSSEIVERLAPRNVATPAAPKSVSANPVLRIVARVMRDKDHGTVIVSVVGGTKHRISLERRIIGTIDARMTIGEQRYEVQDFSDSVISLRRVEDGRLWLLR